MSIRTSTFFSTFSKSPLWVLTAGVVFFLSGIFVGAFILRQKVDITTQHNNGTQPTVYIENLDTLLKADTNSASNSQNDTVTRTQQDKNGTANNMNMLQGPAKCKSLSLGLEVTIPKLWTCQLEDSNDDTGYLSLKSDAIIFNISNYGRGVPDCTVTDSFSTTPRPCSDKIFHSNELITVKFYKTETSSEIFGTIKPQSNQKSKSVSYVSIQYPEMISKDLSVEKIYEIFGILDSIRFVQ